MHGFDIAVKCLLKRRRGHVHSCSEFDDVYSATALEQRSKWLSHIHFGSWSHHSLWGSHEMSWMSAGHHSLDTWWSRSSRSHDVCCSLQAVLGCFPHKNGNGQQKSKLSRQLAGWSTYSLLRSSQMVQRLCGHSGMWNARRLFGFLFLTKDVKKGVCCSLICNATIGL